MGISAGSQHLIILTDKTFKIAIAFFQTVQNYCSSITVSLG